MKSYEELKDIAREYVREKEGDGKYINEPVFRYDNGEFYLGYVVLEFTADSKYFYTVYRCKICNGRRFYSWYGIGVSGIFIILYRTGSRTYRCGTDYSGDAY